MKKKVCGFTLLLIAILFAIPMNGAACEPVIPLVLVFSSSMFLLHSSLLMLGAVFIKSVSFSIFERRIFWSNGVLAIFVANIFSTVIGLILVLGGMSPEALIIVSPLIFIVSIVTAQRLKKSLPELFPGVTAELIAALIGVLFFITFIMFHFAQFIIEIRSAIFIYWLAKFILLFAAVLISIILTTLWEEWIVALIAGKDRSYLEPVLKANLITMIAIMGYAAAMMLPQRINSRGFLAFIQSVGEQVGIIAN